MSWTHSAMHSVPQHAMAFGAMTMLGMATEEDIAALGAMSGDALDIRFLQLMIRHHQGGVAMAQQAMTLSQLPIVRAEAANMVMDQSYEITAMRQLLTTHHAKPLPYP